MKKILLVIFFSVSVWGDNIDYLSISGGTFDFMRKHHRTVETRIEYKPSFNLPKIRPIFGLLNTFNGSIYLYSGLSLDLFFNRYLYFSPNITAGIYFKNGGKDLGFPIEFKSGMELGLRFKNMYRFSAQVSHISNASLGSKNPGCESLVLTLSIPIKQHVKKCK